MDINWDQADFDACLNAARDATRSGQTEHALHGWHVMRERFPERPEAFAEGGALLRDLRRSDDAEQVTARGLAAFPDEASVAVAHAWVAHGRGLSEEADRRWSAIRSRFPEDFGGYFGGGASLRDLRRFDEADEVYRAAFRIFPISVHLLADFALVAQDRGDWEEAQRRWSALKVLFPDDSGVLIREARMLRNLSKPDEADATLRRLLERDPENEEALTEYALVAERRSDWPEALRRWDAVVTRYHSKDGYIGAAATLSQLGRYEDAETVLQPAVRMFAHSPEVAAWHARIAMQQRNYAEAAQRWERFRKLYPDQPEGYSNGILALLETFSIAAAESLVQEGLARFPGEVLIWQHAARAAENAKRFDLAEERWHQVWLKFPQARWDYAQFLSRNGKAEQGEQLLAQGLLETPEDINLNRAYAASAEHRQDWNEADRRWRRVVDLNPGEDWSWLGWVHALSEGGKFDAAEAVLRDATQRFPHNLDIERYVALMATKRRDWLVALQRWSELKARYPKNRHVQIDVTNALYMARQDQEISRADSPDGAVLFEIPANLISEEVDTSDRIRSLLMKFESLGDTCEFGLVQRRFGAEPISLLRWTSTPPDMLVAALDDDLAGVGESEHTVVSASLDEYHTTDRRYHMFAHTFTPVTSEPIERFSKLHLRRMQFLRRKLIDDLKAGEKVFVYKCHQGMSLDQARAIFRAIRRYGANSTLLIVMISDADHPVGSVELLEEGLWIGYIDRHSTIDVNFDAWIALCEQIEPARASAAAA